MPNLFLLYSMQIPVRLVNTGYSYIENWSFAGRLNLLQSEVLHTLQDFLGFFVDTVRMSIDL